MSVNIRPQLIWPDGSFVWPLGVLENHAHEYLPLGNVPVSSLQTPPFLAVLYKWDLRLHLHHLPG